MIWFYLDTFYRGSFLSSVHTDKTNECKNFLNYLDTILAPCHDSYSYTDCNFYRRGGYCKTHAETLSRLCRRTCKLCSKYKTIPVNIHLFKTNNGNNGKIHETCSKLTIKTPAWHRRRTDVFIVNFKQILDVVKVFLILNLNK